MVNKIEIRLIDTEEWCWMGLLTPQNLVKLCNYADELNTSQEAVTLKENKNIQVK